MSASGKRLLAACIFALCSIPVLIVYTWVFTPDLIPHEGIWYCEELDATWDLNTSSGTIQVNGKQEAFVSLHQFYCNLFYFETEDRKNVFYAEEMTPVSNASVLDARLCCIFESDRAGQVLRLTLGGKDNSIFVNGVEVENFELLRDLLVAFVSEETMRVLVRYFDKE